MQLLGVVVEIGFGVYSEVAIVIVDQKVGVVDNVFCSLLVFEHKSSGDVELIVFIKFFGVEKDGILIVGLWIVLRG